MARKVGPHYRVPWTENDPQFVRIAAKYDIVKTGRPRSDRGSGRLAQHRYERAKFHRDHEAAAIIVDTHCTDEWIDRIVDDLLPFLEEGREVVIVWPMPGFAGSDFDHDGRPVTNALPAAVGQFLCDVVGGRLNDSIIQVARPGRTKLKKMQRYLFQPVFEGDVDTSAAYLVVDDACTTGGTLCALRTHIVNKGGTVAAVAALCSPDGEDCPFPLAPETRDMLLSRYGPEIREFWLQEVGHDLENLSEGEGRGLRVWGQNNSNRESLLHDLREKFDKIRSCGDE